MTPAYASSTNPIPPAAVRFSIEVSDCEVGFVSEVLLDRAADRAVRAGVEDVLDSSHPR